MKPPSRTLTTVAFAFTALNAVLNVALQPSLGGVGASLASCITYSASAIGVLYFVVRDSGLPVRDFLIIKPEDLRRLLGRKAV